ncbi:MAG: hypothetical protein ACOX0Z_03765 [Candidatus Nanosyncoccaceae bacterium]|jgi:MFS family permease
MYPVSKSLPVPSLGTMLLTCLIYAIILGIVVLLIYQLIKLRWPQKASDGLPLLTLLAVALSFGLTIYPSEMTGWIELQLMRAWRWFQNLGIFWQILIPCWALIILTAVIIVIIETIDDKRDPKEKDNLFWRIYKSRNWFWIMLIISIVLPVVIAIIRLL